jgi:sugar phosphate isomerase/epimerase
VTTPISQYGFQSSPLNVGLSGSFGVTAALQNQSVAPLRLSLNQLTTLRWSLLEEVVQLKQTGYDAIGLWRPKLAEFGEAWAADLLQRARLGVSSLSFAGGFTGGCGFSYLDAIADTRQAIEQARSLGARNVIVVGGSQNGHTDRHCRRLVVEGIGELVDDAAAADINLCLLPMHRRFSKKWTFVNSLDQALDILAQIDHPQVRLAFDTFHLCNEARLLERIREIAHLTAVVQLCDSTDLAESHQDRLLPGDGKIPLMEIVQTFQTVGYSGYFDVQALSDQVWQGNYAHQIEQAHAAVKAMSLRTALSPSPFSD